MLSLKRPALLLALAAYLAISSAYAEDSPDQFAPVREKITSAIKDDNIPSIAVAVAKDGKIIWEEGFGLADRENRTPATEHTLYSVASVSKPVTATGLMVLVERGKVDLDKPIDNYLGEVKLRAFVGNAADATVRRVANHTAGLPLHYQFFYEGEPYEPPSFAESIRRYGTLMTAPGERYHYANFGYGLLDHVITQVSGKPYADFMREEVFLPLGMTHTSIDVGPGLEGHQAIRYTPEGKRIPFYKFDHPGASAVYSSAHDLARFAMFHMGEHLADQKQILKDESLDEMQRDTAIEGKGPGYGIGWGTAADDRGYEYIQHTGGMPGVATTVRFIPSERLAIVSLANSRSPLAYRLPDLISEVLLPEKEKPAEEKKEESSPTSSDEKKDRDSTLSSELHGTWRGKLVTYQGEAPLRLVVQPDGDVHVRVGDQLETLLSNATFQGGFLRGRFAGKVPFDDARGRDYQVQLELKLRDDVLNGSATTQTLPDAWGNNAVTHWAEVKRQ
jgi:CubicO group peptidase (beta-lactamase class C family)